MDKFKQKILTAVTEPEGLTASQCEMIIQDAGVIGMKRAPVLAKDGSNVRSRTRTCSSCWIPKALHYNWLYNYVWALACEINDKNYKFAIHDMQQLQVLRYRPFQKFRWHFDTYDGSERKLTMVINLSKPTSYLGGGLQVEADWHNSEYASEQGAISVFPSWIKHRARAPWFGERWVLVAWITGPEWR